MKTEQLSIPDLWTLVRGAPWIDPHDLAAAIGAECRSSSTDYRTRLLIREGLLALCRRWGESLLMNELPEDVREMARDLLKVDPGETGFPTLGDRMRDRTDAATILSFFRELGAELGEPARLEVGGSSALILAELLRRGTDDIDVVNEVPAGLRTQHELLSRLTARHGLLLAHFQSHYLPSGYANRLGYLDRFRLLDVYLVDPLDIFVGKLFSKRDKDLDDLRMLKDRFAQDDILARVKASAQPFLEKPQLQHNAQRNWYILFGEDLPAS
jgi:hypothetical protein